MYKDTNKFIKIIRMCFFFAVVFVLLSGIVCAAFFPKEVNEYESRMAEQLPELDMQRFEDGVYQLDMDAALKDQFPMSSYFKKAYNILKSEFIRYTAMPIAARTPDKYFKLEFINTYNNMFVYSREDAADGMRSLASVQARYNELVNDNRDVEFFQYYVENDHDINFETGEKSGVYEYIKENSAVDEQNISRFRVDNFDDYKDNYYRTDIHWNYKGSYKGYKEIMALMRYDGELLEASDEVTFAKLWRGSKAKELGDERLKETFSAYKFEYPEMRFFIEGNEAEDFGRQTLCLEDLNSTVSYMSFYGDTCSIAEIDTDRPEEENILVIGDSFSLAIFKLVASHFNRSFLVDPRRNDMTVADYKNFLETNKIDKVLFLNYYITISDDRFIIAA